jgi:hypothetical protein
MLLVPATLLAIQVHARRLAATAVPAWTAALVAGYLVQAATWYSFDGTLLPFGQDPLAQPTLSDLGGVLFSPGYRGWISWTPLVLFGLTGLTVLAFDTSRPGPRWVALAALLGVAGMVLLDVMHPFGAGAAYGGRRYVSVTPVLAIGLSTLLVRSGRKVSGRVVRNGLLLLTAANLLLLFAYEMLVLRHGVYPTLAETVRYAAGFGAP